MAISANGHAKQPGSNAYSSPAVPKKALVPRLVSIIVRYRVLPSLSFLLTPSILTLSLRLFIWYTAFTVFFRCPSSPSDLTPDSPAVCEPYFNLRAAAVPHLQPYYDQYLAPYAEKAQPYVDKAKTHVYTPAVALARTHAAPRLEQAHNYASREWDRTVRPQLDLAQKALTKQYDASLGPHVQKVQDSVEPYYTSVKTSASDFYELELQPAYKHVAPQAKRLYVHLNNFAHDVALPYTQYTADLVWTFTRRQVWPRLQVLYGENVEPQIFRISQRLGRYRDEKKMEAAANAVASSAHAATTASTTAVAAASSASSPVSSMSSSVQSIMTKASSVIAATPSMAPVDDQPSAADQFADDLKLWQDQVAKAVDDGAQHLRDRVQDICDRQIDAQVTKVGEALIIQLEEASAFAFRSLRAKVQTVIDNLPEDASESDLESAQEKIAQEARKAGQVIKQKAQNVRDWKQTYDKETATLIEAAANSTLETLDNIRDLRLQDIGRRWASNDAITHKDWAKYNELKKTSSQGRDHVEVVALQHPRLADAKNRAIDIEERAMGVAEEAAKELIRLKDVAQWKLDAKDSSDDFSTRYVPPVAAKLKQQVLDKASDAKDAIVGSSQGSVESATSVASAKATEYASSLSEAVLGTETGSVESAASAVSAKVMGTQQSAHESIASVVGESAHNAASAASEAVIGTEPGVGEKAATKVSEAVLGRETPATESIMSAISSHVPDVPIASDASLGPRAASLLSAASSKGSDVASSIQDATSSPSPVASSISSSASSVASSLTDSAPDAASVSSVSSEASSSASSAASKASDSMPYSKSVASDVSSSVSSAASVASESASTATEKASKKVFGGAMAQAIPSGNSIIFDEDIVDNDDIIDDEESYSLRMHDIISRAGDKASQLTQAIEDAIKPATTTQGSVESITSLASAQYESAFSAASSVLFGTEQGVGESMASVAGERYSDAVSA